jgi:hypothetical protein
VRAKREADAAMAQQQAQNMAQEVARAQEALLRAPPPVYSSPYTHNVDTCACGTCHKSRVDSGTSDAYMKRCREASDAAMARLRRQESYLQTALGFEGRSIWGSAAASGGSTDHPDFAKEIFAAMGTPYDSKCPHGLPFYSCMPCSH